jgi:hypothetical protein
MTEEPKRRVPTSSYRRWERRLERIARDISDLQDSERSSGWGDIAARAQTNDTLRRLWDERTTLQILLARSIPCDELDLELPVTSPLPGTQEPSIKARQVPPAQRAASSPTLPPATTGKIDLDGGRFVFLIDSPDDSEIRLSTPPLLIQDLQPPLARTMCRPLLDDLIAKVQEDGWTRLPQEQRDKWYLVKFTRASVSTQEPTAASEPDPPMDQRLPQGIDPVVIQNASPTTKQVAGVHEHTQHDPLAAPASNRTKTVTTNKGHLHPRLPVVAQNPNSPTVILRGEITIRKIRFKWRFVFSFGGVSTLWESDLNTHYIAGPILGIGVRKPTPTEEIYGSDIKIFVKSLEAEGWRRLPSKFGDAWYAVRMEK